jgi:hypothetical protein
MAEQRYFTLVEGGTSGRETAVFTGKQPRQAALKAASRGKLDIWLRERGTKKFHHFKGSRSKVKAPENKPDWMADNVWKPNVKKVGIQKIEKKKGKKKRR